MYLMQIVGLVIWNVFWWLLFRKLDRWWVAKRIRREEKFHNEKIKPLVDKLIKELKNV